MTIQEQYKLIQEGKGDKTHFLKNALRTFPNLLSPKNDFNTTVQILKGKGILNEEIKVNKSKPLNFFKIFEEKTKEIKADSKEVSKEVLDTQAKQFNNKDKKNIDNYFGQSFLSAYYTEMKDPKNKDKTVDELKDIVLKNMSKDVNFYVKDGQFGIKGVGYQTSKETKEVKGKYKSSGNEEAPLDSELLKNAAINSKATSKITNLKAPVLKESKNISLLSLLKENLSPRDLKKGQKYSYTGGAEYMSVTYIGRADENPDKKAGSSMGKGFLFQWPNEEKYFELGPISIGKYIEEDAELGDSITENSMLDAARNYVNNIIDSTPNENIYPEELASALNISRELAIQLLDILYKEELGELDENELASSVGKNYPGSLTGEYEGESVEMEGEELYDFLMSMLKLANDEKDFINKVITGITNDTDDISDEDKEKLSNWYKANSDLNELAPKERDPYNNSDEDFGHETDPHNLNDRTDYKSIGFEAYQNGDEISNNPYSTNSPAGIDWENGWRKAERMQNNNMDSDTKENINESKMNKTEKAISLFKEWKNKPLITEAKKPKKENVASRLKKIEGISEEIAMEAKIEAISEEIEKRNQKIQMAETMDELQEFVNPAKLQEIKKEIKELERYKMKCEKMYERMTGKRSKKETPVTDNGKVSKEEPDDEKVVNEIEESHYNSDKETGEGDLLDLARELYDENENITVDELSISLNISPEEAKELLIQIEEDYPDDFDTEFRARNQKFGKLGK